jgi:hypothetical protein
VISRVIYAICFCAISLWTAVPAKSAEFYGFGQLPGVENPYPLDLSSDGSVVVG